MGYVITQFAPWIFLGALGLGLLVGLFTWDRKTSGSWLSGWLSWAAILFVIGVFAAIFKLIAGRGGLWLETALIMFAVYIVGCLLGNWFRGLFAAAEPVLSAEARAGIGAQARTMTARSAAAGQAGAGATASGVPGSPASEFPPAPDDAPLAIDSSRSYPGQRPLGLAKPERALDDLTRLGVLTGSDQKILNDLGIHHARQIAGWSPENADWINHHIARPGRVQAEGWIGKAAAFVNRQASQAGATGATAGLAGNVLMAGTAAAGDKTATGSGQVSAAGAATAGGSSGAGASGSAGSAASLGGAVPAPAQAVAGSGPVTGVSPTAGSAAAAGQSAGSAGTASSPPAGVAGTPGGSADKGVESVSASPLAGVAAGGSSGLLTGASIET